MSDDVLTAVIHRPLSISAIAEYIQKLTDASVADAEGDGEQAEAVQIDADDIKALLAVKVACRSVTREEAHVRGDLREATFEWVEGKTGLTRKQVDLEKIDNKIATVAMARIHACDILAAIEWDECEGFEFGRPVPEWLNDRTFWEATDDPADWPRCKDWLFSRVLGLTWEANPQWGLAQGFVPFD